MVDAFRRVLKIINGFESWKDIEAKEWMRNGDEDSPFPEIIQHNKPISDSTKSNRKFC